MSPKPPSPARSSKAKPKPPPQTSKSRPVPKSKPTRTPLYESATRSHREPGRGRRSRPFGDRDRGHRSPLEPSPSTLRACNRSPPEKGEFPPAEDECVLARKHGGRAAAIFKNLNLKENDMIRFSPSYAQSGQGRPVPCGDRSRLSSRPHRHEQGRATLTGLRAINPNGKVPAIVDTEGPGGREVSVFNSSAILLYLGDKTKRLIGSPADRPELLSWLLFIASVSAPSGPSGAFPACRPGKASLRRSIGIDAKSNGTIAFSTSIWRDTPLSWETSFQSSTYRCGVDWIEPPSAARRCERPCRLSQS